MNPEYVERIRRYDHRKVQNCVFIVMFGLIVLQAFGRDFNIYDYVILAMHITHVVMFTIERCFYESKNLLLAQLILSNTRLLVPLLEGRQNAV